MATIQTIADVHEYKLAEGSWPGTVEQVTSAASGSGTIVNQLITGVQGSPLRHYKTAIRLGPINLDQGSTVAIATLNLAISSNYKHCNLKIQAIADPNSSMPASDGDTITSKTLTTAIVNSNSGTWEGSSGTDYWSPVTNPYQVNITPIVNEVLGHANFGNGDSIIVVIDYVDVGGLQGRMQLWADEHPSNASTTLTYEVGTPTSVISISGDDYVQLGETNIRVVGTNLSGSTNLRIRKGSEYDVPQSFKDISDTEFYFDLSNGNLIDGDDYILQFNKSGIIYTHTFNIGAPGAGATDEDIVADGHEYAPEGAFPGTWETQTSVTSGTSSEDPNRILIGDPGYTANHFIANITIGPIDVPQGATLTNCFLNLRVADAYKTSELTLFAVEDPAAPAIGAGNTIYSQSFTIASVFEDTSNWPGSAGTDAWTPTTNPYPIDITPLVNEVVGHANWTENSNIQIVLTAANVPGYTGHIALNSIEGAGPVSTFAYELDTSPSLATFVGLHADGTIKKGDTGITLNGVNLENTTAVRINGGGQSVTQVLNSVATDALNIDFVQENLGYGPGYEFEIDSAGGTYTLDIGNLIPEDGWGFVLLNAIVNDNSTLAYNADPPLQDGDVFAYEITSGNGFPFIIHTSSKPIIMGGSGNDTFTAQYRNVNGTWGDVFDAEFKEPDYWQINKIGGATINIVGEPLADVFDGDIDVADITILALSMSADFVERTNPGFDSVNKPSIKIVDFDKEVTLYAGRDNTIEVQFLESGSPIDLTIADKIELVMNDQIFSDASATYAPFFRKKQGGVLEIQIGELGLVPGEYLFAFILYTPTQEKGVVWNDKGAYTINLLPNVV